MALVKVKKPSIRKKILRIIEAVNTRVVDMEDVVWGVFLAILSGGALHDGRLIGEHLFMIGPPGVGKSYVMDVIMRCIKLNPEDFFDTLMHQFTTPDEVLGGTDVKAFMEEHVQRRDIKGFLPGAIFAVMDEIWKAGPVTTSVFKITNERLFKNGKDMIICPLLTMLAASNEYPVNPMDAPLWDRILFRYKVGPVEGYDSWSRMYAIEEEEWEHPSITIDEIMEAKRRVNLVEFPEEVKRAMYDAHVGLAKLGIELSPRRRKKQKFVVMANAWLSGRTCATVEDVSAIIPTCWRHDKEIPQVKRIITKMTNFALDKMMTSFDVGYKIYEECRALIRAYDASNGNRELLEDIDDKAISLGDIREELRVMGEKTSGSNAAEYRRMMAQVSAWHKEVLPYGELRGMKG
jgi:MoxR-like ATPase